MNGLKEDEIRLHVRMLSPISLGAGFGLAKIQEEYMLSSSKSWNYNGSMIERKPYELPMERINKTQKDFTSLKKISSSQMDKIMGKGLSYHYDDKWGPGHVCKKPKVYF